jgi:hypothetical protein
LATVATLRFPDIECRLACYGVKRRIRWCVPQASSEVGFVAAGS